MIERLRGPVVAAGAAVPADGSVAVESLHIDTTVEMCPYFRIDPTHVELWKAQCDAFYEQAKRKNGMLFYGFCFKEGSSEVHIRMGFRDASALLAHLSMIDVPLDAAMKLSQLDRVEFHGPHKSLAKLQKADLKFGSQPIMWFEREAQSLRRATQYSGHPGSDATVSLGFHYAAREEQCACSGALKRSAEALRAQASNDVGLEHHAFSFDGASAVVQQGFTSARGAIDHLIAFASHHGELLQEAVLKRCELRGPPSEIEKIKAFVAKEARSVEAGKAHAVNVLKGAVVFTLDDWAIRRSYAGIDAGIVSTRTAVEHSISANKPVVETVAVPRCRSTCGWSWFRWGKC